MVAALKYKYPPKYKFNVINFDINPTFKKNIIICTSNKPRQFIVAFLCLRY